VPDGAIVELIQGGISATHDMSVQAAPIPGAPHVKVRTRGGFGTTRIRNQPRRRDSIKAAVRGVLGL
jgi:hypothetical protein